MRQLRSGDKKHAKNIRKELDISINLVSLSIKFTF